MISNFPEEAEFIREVFDDAYIYIYIYGWYRLWNKS